MKSATTTMIMIMMARRTQEWLRARPLILDVLFVILIALLALADLTGDGITDTPQEVDAVAVTLVVLGSAALLWRKTSPIPVLVLAVLISCLIYVRNYGSYAAAVGLVALYSVTAHEDNRLRAWIAIIASYLTLLGVASVTLLADVDGIRWSSALSMTLTIGATILAGAVIRNKEEIFADTKEKAERAEADRQAASERAVDRERRRIAREMHDVVAHGMSLITVQAAAAREVAHTRPDDAARLMLSVETTGRDALAEMRRMLGVLRNEDSTDLAAERGRLSPQPSLADLDGTIMHCNEAGTPTDLIVSGDQRPLSPGIELAAFRIVQEALTNVVRHGGETATARVELDYKSEFLKISITDTGRGAVSELTRTGSGHGLVGMRERVEIYDGLFAAGPSPGGGYQVDVSLPIGAAAQNSPVISPEPESARSS